MSERISPKDRRAERLGRAAGYTLVEVMLAGAIAAILILGLGDVITTALAANGSARERNALARDVRFAMERMTAAVRNTGRLVLPLVDYPATGQNESLRNPGVLAVTLDPTLDRDLDGVADADNDGDGRVDEDWPRDANFDGAAGLVGLDDNNDGSDGSVGGSRDDDESGFYTDEDAVDGTDNDSDGSIDEDAGADMNGDGAPGRAGIDDDGDGSTDEGSTADDDEDGAVDEDWQDSVAYFLVSGSLVERHPNLNPTSGTDYTQRVLVENVSSFIVQRLPRGSNRRDLVEISLAVTRGNASFGLTQRVRVGGAP